MSRIDDVCKVLGESIQSALRAGGVVGQQFLVNPKGVIANIAGGQVFPGWPIVPELVKIMAKPPGQWQITIFPIGRAKSTTRFSPYDDPIYSSSSAPTLTASVSHGVVTIAGSVGATPLNVHVVINGEGDAYYQAQPGDTPDSITIALESAVNALDLPGVNASSGGATLSISGAEGSLFCNIVGMSGKVSYEVARFERTLDVSVWTNAPKVRSIVTEAIMERVGNAMQTFLTLPDGTLMYVSLDNDTVDDDSQSSYSIYRSHLLFTVEYGLMLTNQVAQLGAIDNAITVNKRSAALYVGGVPTGG